MAAHAQVAEHYRRKIRKGQLAPGDRMPQVRAMANTWAVSTRTAWLAMKVLRDEGWIAHHQGKRPVILGVPTLPPRSAAPGGLLDNQGKRAGVGPRSERSGGPSPGSLSEEEKWLAAHRREILAVAREALAHRDLGNARAVEALAEVERDVQARRVTPGSFSTLQVCLVDLRWSPGAQAAAADHPVYGLLDRWAALLAEHPSQRRP